MTAPVAIGRAPPVEKTRPRAAPPRSAKIHIGPGFRINADIPRPRQGVVARARLPGRQSNGS